MAVKYVYHARVRSEEMGTYFRGITRRAGQEQEVDPLWGGRGGDLQLNHPQDRLEHFRTQSDDVKDSTGIFYPSCSPHVPPPGPLPSILVPFKPYGGDMLTSSVKGNASMASRGWQQRRFEYIACIVHEDTRFSLRLPDTLSITRFG